MNGNGKSVRNGAYRRGNGGPNGNWNGAPEERAGYGRDFDPAAETGGYSSADYGVADRSYGWRPEARSSGNVQHGPCDYGRKYGEGAMAPARSYRGPDRSAGYRDEAPLRPFGGGSSPGYRSARRREYDPGVPGGFEPEMGGYLGYEEPEGSHRGKGPKSYVRSDDRIHADICDRLTDDSRLDASNIEVRVSDGEVTLTGYVLDRAAKRRAEDCSDSVIGVLHTQNNIRIEDDRR